MDFDVTAQLSEVSFMPGNEAEEILQNVRTILTTPKYSVPLDRTFGLSTTMLDAPIPVAQARLTAEIISAIHLYEPRVRVTKVLYQGDAMDGVIRPTVRVRIVGTS